MLSPPPTLPSQSLFQNVPILLLFTEMLKNNCTKQSIHCSFTKKLLNSQVWILLKEVKRTTGQWLKQPAEATAVIKGT